CALPISAGGGVTLACQAAQPAALAFAEFAPGNAEQPGTERAAKIGTRIETRDMFPGEDERLLCNVVGIARAQPSQEGAQSLLVHMDQTPESVGRTGPGACHQDRFGNALDHRR